MAWTRLVTGNCRRWQRTYALWQIGIARITTTSSPIPCTAGPCPWHKRSIRPATAQTLSLPGFEKTSKPSLNCCALPRVVWRTRRWKKQKRLADRVHASTKYRSSCRVCDYTTHDEWYPAFFQKIVIPFEPPNGQVSGTIGIRNITMNNWLPKSVLCFKSYSKRMFASDLLAGITVGLVALPLAMAFAIASGVPPQTGLYCAIVAGFAISALGGSSTQIGGPTGAFVVVVFGIVAKHGVDGLFMCTLMAGVILLILGVTGLGTAVKFIPRPVVVGFTNGIAVIIASTQIKDFFGLKIDKVPGEFAARISTYAHNFSSFSPLETTLAVSALVVIILFMIFVKRIPGYIVALFAGTAAVVILRLPVETIGTRFGGIPSG